ncbi:FAD-dependent monooxygenase [Streptomyces sp. NPDC046939]|uniref:NAD(P)/FAD-dependent oxidoreductase n=1 Tax=Streptomyces sp. NPDC046939 TaxID=3155376 RepID=UPI0033E8F08D
MTVNGSSIAGGPTAVERFDVIIVGARCAGSPLAALLARAGLKVAVLEQATFPRPTLSSHLLEADGLKFLDRLGVRGPVERTGVRFMKHTDTRLGDFRVRTRFPLAFDDLGGAAFLQRHLLDAILADEAAASGADLRMGTRVVEVLWHRGRVCGVRAERKGVSTRLHAPLVVGADGRASTVAYMCGSHKYNVNPNQRSYYFAFFENADPAHDDLFVFHRWGDRMVWAGPADHGLYLCGVSPERHEREYFRGETEAGLWAHLRACEPTAAALADARIAQKISGIVKFDGYLRQASGPGWVLVGDAGHFKDPAAGRGIGDAFLQVEALVPAIVGALDGTARGGADAAMRRWGVWRDRRFEGHYWLATILGEAGPLPGAVEEALRRLDERGQLDRFFDLYAHRSSYYDVFPLRDMGLATARRLVSGAQPRGPLLKETLALLAREPRRRWINRHPAYATSDLTAPPAARTPRTTQKDRRETADAAHNG